MLNQKKVLDDDLALAWSLICGALGQEGRDFHTVSMRSPKGEERWFHASSNRGRVIIEKAKDSSKNSHITSLWSFGQNEFEIVARCYNKYASGDQNSGIHNNDSHNVSYIITMIDELL